MDSLINRDKFTVTSFFHGFIMLLENRTALKKRDSTGSWDSAVGWSISPLL